MDWRSQHHLCIDNHDRTGAATVAVIELQAGEVFSHTHDVVTTTALVDGEIELTMNGVTMRLTKTPVVVPASTPHVLRNVGTTIARFACGGYGAGGESG